MPEQVHLALAGPSSMAVSWVTWPQDDARMAALLAAAAADASGGGARRLLRGRRHGSGAHGLGRASAGCAALLALGLRSVVQYGTSPGNYDQEVEAQEIRCYSTSGYQSGALHHAVIGGGPEGPLPFDTTIYYRCGDPSLGMSEERSFRTAPRVGAGSLPYRLALVGDLGQTMDSLSTLEHLAAARPDSVLLEGNHEIEDEHGEPAPFLAYRARFFLPHRSAGSDSPLYYSCDVAGAHIVLLGTTATRTTRGRGRGMRRSFERLLYEAGVDVVFAGHVHAYERTHRVYDGRRDDCGPVYINIGDGGNREGLATRYLDRPAWSAFREPSFGHGTLDLVNATHAVWSWRRNVDATSEVAEQLTIERHPACKALAGARAGAALARGSWGALADWAAAAAGGQRLSPRGPAPGHKE
eukprot:scaffold10.g2286.t1